MSNWKRVKVEGTCAETEIDTLRKLLDADFVSNDWGPLCCGGLFGLPNFALETFDVIGNLGERDYDADGVRVHLAFLCERVTSLRCRVHVGADYESNECVATVVADGHTIYVAEPAIDRIPEISEEQIFGQLNKQLNKYGSG